MRVWAGEMEEEKSWVRRKQCSGGPRSGLKGEGRGEECMGMDLGMWQQEWESERDRKQTGYIFLAMPLKRGVSLSETTIVAFPTVPLLQQAGILYRRPLGVSKWRTKSVFHIWAKEGQMHAYTHTQTGHQQGTHVRPKISITYNHSGRERNTDSYPKQSQRAAASKAGWHPSAKKSCGRVQLGGIQNVLSQSCPSPCPDLNSSKPPDCLFLGMGFEFRYLSPVNIKELKFKCRAWIFLLVGTLRTCHRNSFISNNKDFG